MENTPNERLKNLRKSRGFAKPEQAAERYGWSIHTYVAHESGARNITPKKAKLYAEAFGSTPEYILFKSTKSVPTKSDIGENIRATQPMLEKSSIPPKNILDMVPLYGPRNGDPNKTIYLEDSFVIGHEYRPPALEHVKDGFMVLVTKDNMQERMSPGEKVWVHPYHKPLPTDDCVVVLEPKGEVIIKRYLGETEDKVHLMQLNPKKDVFIDKKNVRTIHFVAGIQRR